MSPHHLLSGGAQVAQLLLGAACLLPLGLYLLLQLLHRALLPGEHLALPLQRRFLRLSPRHTNDATPMIR